MHAPSSSSTLRCRATSNEMEHEEVTTKRIIIDTDPGIDDTAAIFLALASPELHVEALTTVYGNGTITDCTGLQNTVNGPFNLAAPGVLPSWPRR